MPGAWWDGLCGNSLPGRGSFSRFSRIPGCVILTGPHKRASRAGAYLHQTHDHSVVLPTVAASLPKLPDGSTVFAALLRLPFGRIKTFGKVYLPFVCLSLQLCPELHIKAHSNGNEATTVLVKPSQTQP